MDEKQIKQWAAENPEEHFQILLKANEELNGYFAKYPCMYEIKDHLVINEIIGRLRILLEFEEDAQELFEWSERQMEYVRRLHDKFVELEKDIPCSCNS